MNKFSAISHIYDLNNTDTKEQNNIDVKLIIGPITLTEHVSNKYNRHIYIFGDMHVNKSTCSPDKSNWSKMKIDDYIGEKILNTNKDKVIDIFSEVNQSNSFVFNIFYLTNINYKFQPCYQSDRKDCKYPNLRFHYVDIRGEKDAFETLTYLRDLIKQLQYVNKVRNKLGNDFNNIAPKMKTFHNRSMVNHLKINPLIITDIFSHDQYDKLLIVIEEIARTNSSDSKIKSLKLSNLLNYKKILKQVDAISNKEIKEKLLEWLDKKFKEYVNFIDFNGLLTTITLMKENHAFYPENFIAKISNRLTMLGALIMDVYLLARLFKKFKQRDKEYAEETKYIVIYAGDLHSDNYREFLNILGFKVVQQTKSDKEGKDFQCLDISQFDQPFFKYNREPVSHVI